MSSSVICGPLLRYTYTDYSTGVWYGSLLVVLGDDIAPSPLQLLYGARRHSSDPRTIFSEHGYTFWRYSLAVPTSSEEHSVEYRIDNPPVHGSFSIPGNDKNMRIMFHSCNGFSVKVAADKFAGPALWNDVLRGMFKIFLFLVFFPDLCQPLCLVHAEHPFHVMLGGGDQIYSDRICVEGPLQAWARDLKPSHRARTPFTLELSRELDEWYFNNYVTWYTTSPFREASASIPSLQLWDDHDIIDGYGSYQDRFMRSPIFLGIGKAAHKYYFLFQQHTPPLDIEIAPDPSFVLGKHLGPYIPSRSVSLCTKLGPRTVFFGLECRTERTRTRICYESTYDAMFSRLDAEVVKGHTKHLILLLGVPIAYPRLVWLEGLLSNRMITAPMRLGHKLFGIGGGLFNNFDGSSELLDDLNDHWCAVTHKHERNCLVERLQSFAAKKQVRITILSGDVHLAAVGRFFSASKLNIPQNKDPRYMVNVVSSAITNAPPPNTVANLLHRRNHVHLLNWHTHENMMALFREDPQGNPRKNSSTMPARNYAIITEPVGNSTNQNGQGHTTNLNGHQDMKIAKKEEGGIENVSAAAPADRTTRPFALEVMFRVEIDSRDPEGRTKGYWFPIPALEM